MHSVHVRYCGCTASASHPCTQLLRAELFPATLDNPRTAFTFDNFETFHLLTLQGKVSAYDYYLSIVRKTDNVGTSNQKVPHFYLLQSSIC
jgi:hypothetical protein